MKFLKKNDKEVLYERFKFLKTFVEELFAIILEESLVEFSIGEFYSNLSKNQTNPFKVFEKKVKKYLGKFL